MYLKIWRRDGVESLTTLEEGEFKAAWRDVNFPIHKLTQAQPESLSVFGWHFALATMFYIAPLVPELAMSAPTYDPFGTETTYKIKLFLCQMDHKQKWNSQFWL